jgi:hypothetical protein
MGSSLLRRGTSHEGRLFWGRHRLPAVTAKVTLRQRMLAVTAQKRSINGDGNGHLR